MNHSSHLFLFFKLKSHPNYNKHAFFPSILTNKKKAPDKGGRELGECNRILTEKANTLSLTRPWLFVNSVKRLNPRGMNGGLKTTINFERKKKSLVYYLCL